LIRRLASAFALAAASVGGLGCVSGSAAELRPSPAPAFRAAGLDRGETRSGAVTDNVVLVSIDGLRPDAIDAFGARTLQRLMREGTYTLAATTILPSKTLPSHTSMLTGEDVDEHGITWNSNQTQAHGHVDVPTIFDVARRQGLPTAAFFAKTKFEHLQREGSLDYTQAPSNRLWGLLGGKWPVSKTLGDVERYLEGNRPRLLFVHVGEPDYAGHRNGWMTPRYGEAVRTADAAVARLLAAADRAYGAGGYTLIVTADHGGHDRDHGSSDPRDVTIPWIAWGKGVQAGTRVAGAVRTFDTASTALWLLGLAEPSDWTGTPVVAAFAAPGSETSRVANAGAEP
jgi:predicted AlkP superfamily pyrophosphatase or phosphodiesterase